jgi:hypothetical protein
LKNVLHINTAPQTNQVKDGPGRGPEPGVDEPLKKFDNKKTKDVPAHVLAQLSGEGMKEIY